MGCHLQPYSLQAFYFDLVQAANIHSSEVLADVLLLLPAWQTYRHKMLRIGCHSNELLYIVDELYFSIEGCEHLAE